MTEETRHLETGDLHADHLAAHEDHAKWLEDLARWRAEYEEALMDLARRALPDLELENFEAALVARAGKPRELLVVLTSDVAAGAERLTGFDTFWYNWVSVNEGTHLVR